MNHPLSWYMAHNCIHVELVNGFWIIEGVIEYNPMTGYYRGHGFHGSVSGLNDREIFCEFAKILGYDLDALYGTEKKDTEQPCRKCEALIATRCAECAEPVCAGQCSEACTGKCGRRICLQCVLRFPIHREVCSYCVREMRPAGKVA